MLGVAASAAVLRDEPDGGCGDCRRKYCEDDFLKGPAACKNCCEQHKDHLKDNDECGKDCMDKTESWCEGAPPGPAPGPSPGPAPGPSPTPGPGPSPSPGPAPPGCGNIFDVTDYGADSTGKSDSTQAVQKTFDALVKAGCGTAQFPSGSFVFGHVSIQNVNDATLIIDSNAQLTGKRSLDGWPRASGALAGRRAGDDRAVYLPWIYVSSCKNFVMRGAGQLDGSGDFWWKTIKNKEEDNPRPFMTQFDNVNGLTLTDFKLVNTPHVHMKFSDSSNVKVRASEIQSHSHLRTGPALYVANSFCR